MTPRIVLALALALSALVLPAPAQAAPERIVIKANRYDKDKVTVGLGKNVRWVVDDDHQHSTTSDQQFWDSGLMNDGDAYSHSFNSAGTFRYHCSDHRRVHGVVKVKLAAKGSAGDGWRVRWATVAAPLGRNYDVQYKRKGAKGWQDLRTNTVQPDGRFNPRRDGTYLVRARTSNTDADKSSAWSPTRRLLIR